MMPLLRLIAVLLLGMLTFACQDDRQPAGSDRAQVPAGLPAEMLGVTWQWIGVSGAAEPVSVDTPDRYTITFTAEGRALVRADCNRGSGGFTAGANRGLTLGAIALTRVGCPPGSLEGRYVRELNRISGYRLSGPELDLELSGGAGAMRFRRAG